MKPKIITFEGIDGAGKSTLVKSLRDHFTAKGLSVFHTWEPWSVTEIDPDPFIATMQLMIDRRRQCAMIREISDQYDLILIDRFDLSTVAYQGYGDGIDLGLIQRLNDDATEDIEVTSRIWLDLPVGVAVERLHARGENVTDNERSRLSRICKGYSLMYLRRDVYAVADFRHVQRLKYLQAHQSPDAMLKHAIEIIEEVL